MEFHYGIGDVEQRLYSNFSCALKGFIAFVCTNVGCNNTWNFVGCGFTFGVQRILLVELSNRRSLGN